MSANYRPDVDGLRAVAVLAVILFHMDERWLPGGMHGVVMSAPEGASRASAALIAFDALGVLCTNDHRSLFTDDGQRLLFMDNSHVSRYDAEQLYPALQALIGKRARAH